MSRSVRAPVILKKYGNRRIYDARQSGYVTLTEVERMVKEGEEVQIIDAKSGEDLTNQVLVQIILDTRAIRNALPTAFLRQVVRVADSPLGDTFTRALSGLVGSFVDAQRGVLHAQRETLQQLPQIAAQNPFLQMAMNPFAMFAPPPARTEPPPAPAPAAHDAELELLRSQLAETRDLVNALARQQMAPEAQPQATPTPPTPAPQKPKRKRTAKARSSKKASTAADAG